MSSLLQLPVLLRFPTGALTPATCSLTLTIIPFLTAPPSGISKQNLLKSEQSAAKIKRNFSANGGMAGGGVNEDAIEQTAITVSLKCPITQQAIRLPARGRDCKHIQCFDLENFLIMNSRKASWSCPVCKYVTNFCRGLLSAGCSKWNQFFKQSHQESQGLFMLNDCRNAILI